MKIIISRTDSIGDVILTLPLCGWIKQNIPNSETIFLCQKLTTAIVARSAYVDKAVVWEGSLPEADAIIHVFPNKEVAKEAKAKGILLRIGTSHRIFHWATCNKLINFTRKKSELHESQLNFKLLQGLVHDTVPALHEMADLVGWTKQDVSFDYLKDHVFNLVFHIKSRGSAKEWAAENYLELAESLGSLVNIILTGTAAEKDLIEKEVPGIFQLENVTDTTGQLSLAELIDLIGHADGLLACSTGPLHIAAASGIHALGLYPEQRPMHAGRWQPIGAKAQVISERGISQDACLDISVEEVEREILKWMSDPSEIE